MKKLLLSTLFLIPTTAMAADTSLVGGKGSVEYHEKEAARLESKAQELLSETKGNPVNTFLNTKFPDSSAAPQKIARNSVAARKEANSILAQANEHKQMAANLQGELDTLRAQPKTK